MLQKLKKLLDIDWTDNGSQAPALTPNEACALLLVEVAKADFDHSISEQDEVARLLKVYLSLSDDELNELLEFISKEGDNTTSLHPYTSVINEHYDYNKRVEMISLMWKVAYADGELDKYEDSVIRKVADLLYVSHRDFIATKLDNK